LTYQWVHYENMLVTSTKRVLEYVTPKVSYEIEFNSIQKLYLKMVTQ